MVDGSVQLFQATVKLGEIRKPYLNNEFVFLGTPLTDYFEKNKVRERQNVATQISALLEPLRRTFPKRSQPEVLLNRTFQTQKKLHLHCVHFGFLLPRSCVILPVHRKSLHEHLTFAQALSLFRQFMDLLSRAHQCQLEFGFLNFSNLYFAPVNKPHPSPGQPVELLLIEKNLSNMFAHGEEGYLLASRRVSQTTKSQQLDFTTEHEIPSKMSAKDKPDQPPLQSDAECIVIFAHFIARHSQVHLDRSTEEHAIEYRRQESLIRKRFVESMCQTVAAHDEEIRKRSAQEGPERLAEAQRKAFARCLRDSIESCERTMKGVADMRSGSLTQGKPFAMLPNCTLEKRKLPGVDKPISKGP